MRQMVWLVAAVTLGAGLFLVGGIGFGAHATEVGGTARLAPRAGS